jgi:hypothetical protein
MSGRGPLRPSTGCGHDSRAFESGEGKRMGPPALASPTHSHPLLPFHSSPHSPPPSAGQKGGNVLSPGGRDKKKGLRPVAAPAALPAYNPLVDPNLRQFFSSGGVQRQLYNVGLVSQEARQEGGHSGRASALVTVARPAPPSHLPWSRPRLPLPTLPPPQIDAEGRILDVAGSSGKLQVIDKEMKRMEAQEESLAKEEAELRVRTKWGPFHLHPPPLPIPSTSLPSHSLPSLSLLRSNASASSA